MSAKRDSAADRRASTALVVEGSLVAMGADAWWSLDAGLSSGSGRIP